LSATLSVAAKDAADEGANVTEIAHFAPTARLLPQLLVCAKLLAPVPVNVIPERVSAALPVFVSVAVCAALVVPVIVVKVSVAGVRVTAGKRAVKFAVTPCGAFMVMVVEALVVLATLPVQVPKAKPAFGVAVRFTTVPGA
jgi:hypothetical protein